MTLCYANAIVYAYVIDACNVCMCGCNVLVHIEDMIPCCITVNVDPSSVLIGSCCHDDDGECKIYIGDITTHPQDDDT